MIKPVAWLCDANDGANADVTTRERVRDDYARFGRQITPLYAIPETHRIVSVELLEMILKFAEDATEHYSFMNDEVCQSYSDSWQQGLNVCRELRAAIDNK